MVEDDEVRCNWSRCQNLLKQQSNLNFDMIHPVIFLVLANLCTPVRREGSWFLGLAYNSTAFTFRTRDPFIPAGLLDGSGRARQVWPIFTT